MSQRVELNENQKIYIGRETELIQNIEFLIEQCKKSYGDILGKIPPQALEIEAAVIGAVLLETKGHGVFSYLLPEHFYSTAHEEIYRACLDLHKKGLPIDMRTVVVELRKSGKLEVVGGAFEIADITSKVSSSANIDYHARLVIEFAIKRKMIMVCGSTLSDCYADTMDCFEILDSLELGVNEVKGWTKK